MNYKYYPWGKPRIFFARGYWWCSRLRNMYFGGVTPVAAYITWTWDV